MKVTTGQEEITMSRIGELGFKVVWDLLKIVTSVALTLWLIWIVVPPPRGLFLFYAPWACAILYALLRRDSGVGHGAAET